MRTRRTPAVSYPDIVIEDGVWIGTDVLILGGPSGLRIGRGAVIGAGTGTVVRRDVPADTVWAGNPAVQLRRLEPLRDEREPRADVAATVTRLIPRESAGVARAQAD